MTTELERLAELEKENDNIKTMPNGSLKPCYWERPKTTETRDNPHLGTESANPNDTNGRPRYTKHWYHAESSKTLPSPQGEVTYVNSTFTLTDPDPTIMSHFNINENSAKETVDNHETSRTTDKIYHKNSSLTKHPYGVKMNGDRNGNMLLKWPTTKASPALAIEKLPPCDNTTGAIPKRHTAAMKPADNRRHDHQLHGNPSKRPTPATNHFSFRRKHHSRAQNDQNWRNNDTPTERDLNWRNKDTPPARRSTGSTRDYGGRIIPGRYVAQNMLAEKSNRGEWNAADRTPFLGMGRASTGNPRKVSNHQRM